MSEAKFKVGDRVNFHVVIDEPATGTYEVDVVQAEGIPSHRSPVYWLKGKAGCVSEDSLSLAVELATRVVKHKVSDSIAGEFWPDAPSLELGADADPRRVGSAPRKRRHALKAHPEFWDAILARDKTFEMRFDDRGFQVGDVLLLRRWDPQTRAYTDPPTPIRCHVAYMMRGDRFGLKPGWVCMAIRILSTPRSPGCRNNEG